MRIITFIIAALLHTVAFAHPADVLANKYSQYLEQLRLYEVSPQENVEARKIVDAFAKVKAAAGIDFPVTLIVTYRNADVFAQSFPGEAIVINSMLVDFPEEVMVFMLAHELGHVRKRDLAKALSFYAEQIPRDATVPAQQEQFDKLQPQMTAFSHGFEFDADAFAATTLVSMGYSLKQPIKFLSSLPHGDTDNVTHPASVERAKRVKSFQKSFL
jgi:predicted Zn-dependent protease